MKRCSKCGEWKEESEFGSNGPKKGGLHSKCKPCDRLYLFEYIKNNPGIRSEAQKKYYRDNIVYAKAYVKEYRKTHKRKTESGRKRPYRYHAAASKKYRETHKDAIKKQKIIASENHPEYSARSVIKQHYGLSNPPQELIDLKAEQIRLFRAVRDKRMGVQEHEG